MMRDPIIKNCGDAICYYCNLPLTVLDSQSKIIAISENGRVLNSEIAFSKTIGKCQKCGEVFPMVKFGQDYVHKPKLLLKGKPIEGNPFLKGG